MDVFAEPNHKVDETHHLDVEENNLYVWAVKEYSDWNLIMTNCCLPSFDNRMKSFSFKLVHGLLPNEERLSRILPHNSPFVLIVKMIPLLTLFMFSPFAVSHKTWEVGC